MFIKVKTIFDAASILEHDGVICSEYFKCCFECHELASSY
jgi:hypothetical protein